MGNGSLLKVVFCNSVTQKRQGWHAVQNKTAHKAFLLEAQVFLAANSATVQ